MDLSKHETSSFPPSSSPDRQSALPVVCRPNPTYWFGVFLYAVGTLFWFCASTDPNYDKAPSSPQTQLIVCYVGTVVFVLAAVFMALFLIRGEMRADETGLKWRNALGGWKQVRWEEITDYYYLRRGNNRKHVKLVKIVETSVGKLALDSSFKGSERIAELVVQKASQTNRQGWEDKKNKSTRL